MNTQPIIRAAARIATQLDQRGNSDLAGLPETLCRALKVQEEAGEMAQAVIGVLGQNPRKGVTHTWDDVVAEAIDVVMSALVFAETVTREHLEYTLADRLAGRLEQLARRAAASGAPDLQPADNEPADDDGPDTRRAATLRWLLAMHTEHRLTLPMDFTGYDTGTLMLRLDDDQADEVHHWAALLGIPVTVREVRHSGRQYNRVKADSDYGSDVTGLGWHRVEITSCCDDQPIDDQAPLAVAA
ncbi:MazG-like family protein [Actinoplanes sp. TRM 88003]|uniref:MazG-like family protein n=1 Tax=Paractinoplanes aksuensis TaxID=2939490 RepID=A0ABT1DQR4_9ACTN|nr:MazG-like family protein [Actinoplanes aksuensis]MCO8272833.1 MazG-like family protein [Actinoplanes aksuensis]